MRSLGGLVLLAGIGVGLFVYLPPVDRNTSLDHARRLASIRTQSLPSLLPLVASTPADIPDKRGMRTFSPGISLTSLAQAPADEDTDATVAAAYPAADTTGGWQAVVSTSAPGAVSPTASLVPNDSSSRYKLVTDIQQQLKRLGCYYGRVDGSWGASTKDAMKTFTDRVNAELPIEEPDYLLLTLLQSQSSRSCDECPPGLVLSANGRCLPRPTVAQSRPAAEVLPWQAAETKPDSARPLFTPVATSVVSSEPLPGRMAIGGPKALPPVDSLDGLAPADAATTQTSVAAVDAVAPAANPQASQRSTSPSESRRASSREPRSSARDPIRHNLLMSLGGVF